MKCGELRWNTNLLNLGLILLRLELGKQKVEGAREVVMALKEGTRGLDSLLTEEKAHHKHEIST